MHATQPQGASSPHPTGATAAGALIGILTDPARFATCLQQATNADDTGYVVTDKGLSALAADDCPSVTPAQVLRNAALYLERHGWIQGAYYDATSGSFTPPACMVGAIGMVCYGGPVDAPAQHFDDPGYLDFEEAVLHLDRYLLTEDGTESYEFNDTKGRTVEQVIHVLRDAATRPAEELIDALRVIDARNAEISALLNSGASLATGRLCPACDGPLMRLGDNRYWCAAEGADVTTYDDGENTSDCQFCGAPGGYPYCQNGQLSCADVVAADDAELAARDGDR